MTRKLDSTICKVGTMTPLSVDLLVRMPIFLQAGGLLVAICLHTASLTSVSFPAARFKLLCNPIRYAFVCKDAWYPCETSIWLIGSVSGFIPTFLNISCISATLFATDPRLENFPVGTIWWIRGSEFFLLGTNASATALAYARYSLAVCARVALAPSTAALSAGAVFWANLPIRFTVTSVITAITAIPRTTVTVTGSLPVWSVLRAGLLFLLKLLCQPQQIKWRVLSLRG